MKPRSSGRRGVFGTQLWVVRLGLGSAGRVTARRCPDYKPFQWERRAEERRRPSPPGSRWSEVGPPQELRRSSGAPVRIAAGSA